MKTDTAAVEQRRSVLLEKLKEDEESHGGYQKWYSDLEPFRRSLRQYYGYNIKGKTYRTRETTISSGDIIDHHIISYLAPLQYKRLGWGGKLRSPSEQIIMLWDYLSKKGTRLIYVPLPNKGMIYQGLISDKGEDVRGDCNAPQFRKILKEIVLGG